MPDEPNKQMDETLRAYAQERRKAPEVSLHPATRNLLQAEVKRAFGSRSASPWWRNLRAFWPHLAFGGGLCIVFGIAILSLRQPSSTMVEGESATEPATQTVGKDMSLTDLAKESKKLEKRASAQGDTDLSEGVKLMEAPPADVVQSSDLKRNTAVEQKLNERVTVRNARPQPAQRTSVGRLPEENRQAEYETLLRSKTAAIEPTAAPETKEADSAAKSTAKAPARAIAPPSENQAVRSVRDDQTASSAKMRARGLAATQPLAPTDQLSNLSAARTLNFVQVSNTPVTAGLPATKNPSTVLTSFQLEQSGTNLRVLDRDGSVYLGVLRPTNAATIVGLKVDQAQTDNSLAYYFRVQGTNRTLNSDVVLTGNYFEQTNPAPATLELFTETPQATAGQQIQTRQQSQTRHYIIGNATVGSTSQVPVRAVSTSP